MISSRKRILLCLVSVCISMMACGARGKAFQLVTDLHENKAVVYVYWRKLPNEYPIHIIKPSITIGGTKMCGLAPGGYIVRIVEPGEIEVTVNRLDEGAVSLQLERGESGYVRLEREPEGPPLKIVLSVLGEVEISKCKKVCGD